METFGILGFTFGILGLVYSMSAMGKVSELQKEVEKLKAQVGPKG